ncbi:MAG: M20/M25/M40 family metallo-hydrolase [Gemmatimonadaceae bacterium]
MIYSPRPFARAVAGCTVLMAIACAPLPAQTRSSPGPRAQRPVDWSALTQETTRVLAEYLRSDTSNPPGNELAGARFLKNLLEREGFEVQLLDTAELGAGRANLYTRLKGNGSKKAIALVHHIDVVPATPSFWTVPPFSGEIRDGYLWGRGAIDMKGEGIMHLMAMIAIKRSGVPLNRDIVFIANADEELGSTGAVVFAQRHADLLRDVEFLITEGGQNLIEDGKLKYFGVSVAEKRTFWQKLRVQGTPSHGSRPTRDNPVSKLVTALARLAAYETPIHLTPGVEKYFRDISRLYQEPQRGWLYDIRNSIEIPAARSWILSNVFWNAYLRTTISVTVLTGSNKTNVIPPEATADVDVRLLPDQDSVAVLAELQRVVNDTSVRFSTILGPKAPLQSSITSDMFRAIERASAGLDAGAFVTTTMLTAATDRPTYQRLGIQTYGLDPFKIPDAERQRGVHGNNERVSLENIAFGVRYVYDILRYVQ